MIAGKYDRPEVVAIVTRMHAEGRSLRATARKAGLSERELSRSDIWRGLNSALATTVTRHGKLDEREAAVIRRMRSDGHDVSRIAHELGRSVGSVKSAISAQIRRDQTDRLAARRARDAARRRRERERTMDDIRTSTLGVSRLPGEWAGPRRVYEIEDARGQAA